MSTFETRCKGVHVKLDKETHASFKTKLIEHGVSMQDAFEEFARQVGAGSPSANNLITRMVREKIRIELAEVGLTSNRKRPSRRLGELDDEKLYDLINEAEEVVDETEVPPPRGGRNEAA